MVDKIISSVIVFLLSFIPFHNASVDNNVTVLFAGDIMLGRSVMEASLDNNDFLYPFRNTSDLLKNADITFVNLENPIIKNCQRHTGGFKFCTTPEIASGLEFAGVDIATLANNHSGNYGKDGLEQTKKYLDEYNVSYVDGNNLIIKGVKGIKFGFLGFDLVSKDISTKDIELIVNSDKLVDILIVGVHWGEEYHSIANNYQTSIAKQIVKAGADVVVGHHPHWVQNHEEINSVPIYYSLGNFIFDQMWSEETKKGLIVKMTFSRPDNDVVARLIETEEFNIYIPKMGQPKIVN